MINDTSIVYKMRKIHVSKENVSLPYFFTNTHHLLKVYYEDTHFLVAFLIPSQSLLWGYTLSCGFSYTTFYLVNYSVKIFSANGYFLGH